MYYMQAQPIPNIFHLQLIWVAWIFSEADVVFIYILQYCLLIVTSFLHVYTY